MREILHCDLNSFYASAECRERPELRRVPMAVCGDPDSRHGIILAKNEHAKRFGVQTAETVASALRKCPGLVLVAAHHDKYERLSREVRAIYARYTDQVEPFGIDECWLDVTGSRSLFGDGETIAEKLRGEVRRETGLTISVGVSFCKVFAKLGSDLKKPDATTLIPYGHFREVVWPLPASSLLYVGRSAAASLAAVGIRTIGDIAAASPERLSRCLGKLGDTIGRYARGEDDEPVRSMCEYEEPKSVGSGLTFARDLVGERDCREGILMLSDEVASRLRRAGLYCRTVQLQIKSPEFRVISRQRRLDEPTDLAREIAAAAMEILRGAWDLRQPIRALTVTAQNLSPEGETVVQPSLFDDPEREKRRRRGERIEATMDMIRGMYGADAIRFGSSLRGGGTAADTKKHDNGH